MIIKNKIIKLSCSLSPNIIDWIRSIYFSLFGSSMLTFILKLNSLEKSSMISFIVGIFCFFIGLLMSLIIANRFKNYEKLFDAKPDTYKLKKSISDYYYEKETEGKNHNYSNNIIHSLFFIIWVPAILTIGYAGLMIEEKSSESSKFLKDKIKHIDSLIVVKEDLEKLKFECKQIHAFNVNIQEENDSLKRIINKEIIKKGTQLGKQ